MGQAASRRRRAGRVRWNRRRLGSSIAKLPGDEVGENDPPGWVGVVLLEQKHADHSH